MAKRIPGVAAGGSAPSGGPRSDTGGCRRGVGTFSRCRSLAGETHVVVAAAARAGPVAPSPGCGTGAGGGSAGGSPNPVPPSPASPRDWMRRSRTGGPAPPPPPPCPSPDPPARAGFSSRCDVKILPYDVPDGCHGNSVMSQRSEISSGGGGAEWDGSPQLPHRTPPPPPR